MKNNDLNQIKMFIQVAKFRSFTKAAESLSVEKSTISNKVSQLEKQLGIKLLKRTTRSVSITEAGQQYLNYCKQAMQTLQEGNDYISSLIQEPTGLLRISTPQNFADILMNNLFTPFLKKYPKIDLEIVQSNRQTDMLNEKFDIAIRASIHDIKDSTLIYRQVYQSERILVCNADHYKRYGKPTTLQHLYDQPNIGVAAEDITGINYNDINWQGQNVKVKQRFSVNSGIAIKQAVQAGLGNAVIPKSMIKSELETGELIDITGNIKIAPSTLYLVYLSRHGQPAKVKALIDYLVNWFGFK